MKQNKYLRHIQFILFGLFIVYNLKDILYPSGSFISKGSSIMIVLISGFYFIKTLLVSSKNNVYKWWTLFFIINLLGYVFTSHLIKYDFTSRIFGILISSITFYPFYYFTQKNVLKSKHLIAFFYIMLPILVGQFYFNRSLILTITGSDNMDLVNNRAYSFVFILPFIFLIGRKRILSFITIFVIMFFIIQGAKRGAIITGFACFILFAYYQLRSLDEKKRIKGYFFILIALFLLSYFVYDLYVNNEYLVYRMTLISEGGSGRDVIYTNIFNAWWSSDNFLNLLFGFGFSASLELSGTGHFAHNDWLELLSNYGLLGVITYLALIVSVFKYALKPNIKIDNRMMIFAILAIWLITSMISMHYMSGSGYFKAMLLAYLINPQNETKKA
jgi:O-antigen ligase